MTEHLNVNPEGEFVDKTVAMSGVKILDGVECNWELHALPEYKETDITLSDGVIGEVALFLKEKGWINATIDLAEGYDNEESGKEHYRLKMIFGSGSDNKKIVFSEHYSAQTGEEEVKGSVKINVGLLSDYVEDYKDLEKNAASIYIKRMEETYTDWKNQWENGEFRVE